MFNRKPLIYLDHNATTPLHPEVQKALVNAFKIYGNPSSLHSLGRQANHIVEQSRKTIAEFIGAKPEELIFVGSGSEANNTVFNLLSCCHKAHCGSSCDVNGAKEIIVTKIEHPCILETAACLAERGTKVNYLPVDRYGKVDFAQLEKMITSATVLISAMMVNNEIGTIQDVKSIAAIARKHGCLFHTDAVQAVGKLPVNVDDLDVDYLSFSGHKIYGPKGIGGLYIKKGAPFCPFIRGGHQERGRRAGTENTLGIIALAKAIEMRRKEMDEEKERLSKLKKILRRCLEKKLTGISFNGHSDDCLAGTLNVSFNAVEGEAVLLYLDLEGIAVSTGSACASGSLDPSHVLMATGISAEQAHGSIRISMGRSTTLAEIKYTIEKITEIILRLRKMSTVK